MTHPPSKPRAPRSGRSGAKPRDPSGGNLGVPFLLRAETEQQKTRWQRAAERAGLQLTAWIRQTLDAAS